MSNTIDNLSHNSDSKINNIESESESESENNIESESEINNLESESEINNIPIPKTPEEFFKHLQILDDAFYQINFCEYMTDKTCTYRYNLSHSMKNIMDILLNHWLD